MAERAVRFLLRPVVGSVALFVALVVLLGWQMGAGRDPLLGRAVHPVTTGHELVREIRRRVIVTTVIVDPGTPGTPAASGAPTASPPSAVSYASPPPPAPLTTGSSGR